MNFIQAILYSCVVLVVLILAFQFLQPGRPAPVAFDTAQWKATSNRECTRIGMAQDLVDKHLPPKMFYTKVLELIGEPEWKVKNCDIYEMSTCNSDKAAYVKLCYSADHFWLQNAAYYPDENLQAILTTSEPNLKSADEIRAELKANLKAAVPSTHLPMNEFDKPLITKEEFQKVDQEHLKRLYEQRTGTKIEDSPSGTER